MRLASHKGISTTAIKEWCVIQIDRLTALDQQVWWRKPAGYEGASVTVLSLFSSSTSCIPLKVLSKVEFGQMNATLSDPLPSLSQGKGDFSLSPHFPNLKALSYNLRNG